MKKGVNAMKKITMVFMILLFLVFSMQAGEETKAGAKNKKPPVVLEIYKVYSQGDFDKVLEMTEKAMKTFGMTMELMHLKYDALIKLKRLDDALQFVENGIKKTGESEELVSARYNVLMLQKRFPDALHAALRKDKIAKQKSPWDCMNIMHVYLQMKSKAEAMDWLQEAVNRGFMSYRILIGPRYILLKNEKRFYEIIETIKVSIGLGNRARNFQAKLLSGEIFNLWRHKGKVILIKFWATWCEGCRKDMPRIKKTYDQFKDKGFEILAVSLDSDEKKMKAYIDKYKLDWKHACSKKVWEDPTVIRYGVNSLPSYWLVDKKGILRSFGLKDRELQKAIAALLAEKK